MLDTVVTTVTGAVTATLGVVVGGVVARRAQDRQWIRDRQLAAYQELFSHQARFTMARRADPLTNPLSPEEFEAPRQESVHARIQLVHAIRRSLGNDRRGLSFRIGE